MKYTLLVDFGLVVLIWIVQLIVYPSFLSINTDVFKAWHSQYTISITLVVLPLMASQLGLSVYEFYTEKNVATGLLLIMVLGMWVITFIVSVPLHNQLQESFSKPAAEKLISTNWWRTIGWTVIFVGRLITQKI